MGLSIRGKVHTSRSIPGYTFVLVFVGYLILRVIEWLGSLPMVTWGDSHSYLPGAGTGIPADFALGFQKVSFTGIDVIRPWTVTVPFSLMPTMTARGLLQTLISCLAFSLLAWALYGLCRNRRIGLALAVTVLLFSLLPEVAAWDARIGRESITISLTALFAGLALMSLRRAGLLALSLTLAVGMLLALTRPTSLLMAAPVMLFCLFRFIRSVYSARLPGASSNPRRALSATIGIGLFAIALVYPYQYSKNLDEGWVAWYGQSMSETQFGYLVSDLNPAADTLISALGDSAPTCVTATLPVDTSQSLGKPFYLPADLRKSCPSYLAWFENDWPSFFRKFMISHPSYGTEQLQNGFSAALTPNKFADSLSVLPQNVHSLMMPSLESARFDPLLGYAVLILLILLLRKRLASRGKPWEKNLSSGSAWIVTLLILGGLAGIGVNLLILPTHFEDIQRINLASSLSIRLAVLIALVAFGSQAWMNRSVIASSFRQRRSNDDVNC